VTYHSYDCHAQHTTVLPTAGDDMLGVGSTATISSNTGDVVLRYVPAPDKSYIQNVCPVSVYVDVQLIFTYVTKSGIGRPSFVQQYSPGLWHHEQYTITKNYTVDGTDKGYKVRFQGILDPNGALFMKWLDLSQSSGVVRILITATDDINRDFDLVSGVVPRDSPDDEGTTVDTPDVTDAQPVAASYPHTYGWSYQAPPGTGDPMNFGSLAGLPDGVVVTNYVNSVQGNYGMSELTNNSTQDYCGYLQFWSDGAYGLRYNCPGGESTRASDSTGWSAFSLKAGETASYGWVSSYNTACVSLFLTPSWQFVQGGPFPSGATG